MIHKKNKNRDPRTDMKVDQQSLSEQYWMIHFTLIGLFGCAAIM